MKTQITKSSNKNYVLKPLYFLVFALLLNNTIYAQCEDVSVDDLTSVGPYNVGTLTESDGLRNGPDYTQATLYYPTDAPGPYPSVILVPGFTNSASAIASWGPFYASHGVMAFIVNTNSNFAQPAARATAMLDAMETIKQENTRSNSPLEGKVDTERFGVSGYSMGGGGSLIASTRDTSIKVVIGLAPWLPNVNGNTLSNNGSATLLISGENDSTASPNSHANRHYTNLPDATEKALFELNNGSHSTPQLPQNRSGLVGRVALAWVKANLQDDPCFCNILKEDLLVSSSASSDIRIDFTCETLGTDSFEDKSAVTIFPNPTSTSITVKNINFSGNTSYNITNVSGQLLMSGDITSNRHKIDISNLASSVYFLNIGDNTFKVVKTN